MDRFQEPEDNIPDHVQDLINAKDELQTECEGLREERDEARKDKFDLLIELRDYIESEQLALEQNYNDHQDTLGGEVDELNKRIEETKLTLGTDEE